MEIFKTEIDDIHLLDISNLREITLESRQLEALEINALKNNEDFELQLENYLISISKIDKFFSKN